MSHMFSNEIKNNHYIGDNKYKLNDKCSNSNKKYIYNLLKIISLGNNYIQFKSILKFPHTQYKYTSNYFARLWKNRRVNSETEMPKN